VCEQEAGFNRQFSPENHKSMTEMRKLKQQEMKAVLD
jgi:hypothetical protein